MVFWVANNNGTKSTSLATRKQQERTPSDEPKLQYPSKIKDRSKKSKRYLTKMDAPARLLYDLLKPERYSRHMRPVFNYDQPVKVTIGLNLYQILNVNERDENILLYMWTRQLWDDAYMGWDPIQYWGINWTTLPWNRLWIPDTYVYNSINVKATFTSMMVTTSAVDPNATKPYVAHIRFMYPTLYRFSCNMDMKYFPFDRQNCSMVFGSWTLDGAAIDYHLLLNTVRFESYVPNEEWSVISFKMVRRENWYTCCPFPYIELHAHLVIQRKPLYYIVNLVVPIIIIVVIAAFGFFTPVSSGGERTERVELGVNTILAMSILLVILADKMPTTSSSVPLISWFYLVNIVLIAVGTVLSSTVLIIQQQGHHRKQLPSCMRRMFFNFVGPLMCICPLKMWKKQMEKRKTRHFVHLFRRKQESGTKAGVKTLIGLVQKQVGLKNSTEQPLTGDSISEDSCLLREIHKIKSILYSIQESQDLQDRELAIKLEWEYFAIVLDRALLIIFMGVFIVFITIFFSHGFSLLNHEDDPSIHQWKEI